MGSTGHKGVDVRQTGNRLVFRALVQDSSGAILTTGTTSLSIYELQDDGTLKSYDFNDNTFKTTALTTATASMTHRTGNNSTTNTGIWSYVLSTLTGFTNGAIYFAVITNSGASPVQQVREFQYGSAEGDLVVTANGTGVGEMNADVVFWEGSTAPAMTGDAYARLGAPAGASISADIAAVLSYLTTNLGLLGVNLSAIPKTGFKLASDGLSAVTAWTVNITGTLSGSVGSVASYGTLISDIWSYVARTITDKTGFSLTAAYDAAKTAASQASVTAVKAKTDQLAFDSFGVAASTKNLKGTVDGGTLQVTAWALSGDPANEGAVLSPASDTIALPSMIEDVSGNRFTSHALMQSPSGGGGNVTVGGYATGQDPATLVLDATAASYNTTGTIGAKINAAGGAADPLSNDVPGTYPAGTAGYQIGQIATAAEIAAQLASANVTYSGPVYPDGGTVQLTIGDDYYTSDGLGLPFLIGGAFPSWVGATVELRLSVDSFKTAIAGVIDVATGSTRQVHFDVPHSITDQLVAALDGIFQIAVTLSNSHVSTVVKTGKLIVTRKV